MLAKASSNIIGQSEKKKRLLPMFSGTSDPGPCTIAKQKSTVNRRKSVGNRDEVREKSTDVQTLDTHRMLNIGHRPSTVNTNSCSSFRMLNHWQSVIRKRQILEAQYHRETWQGSCRPVSCNEPLPPKRNFNIPSRSIIHRRISSCMSSSYKREGLGSEKKALRKSTGQHLRPKTAMNTVTAFPSPLYKSNLILADQGKRRNLSAQPKVNPMQHVNVMVDALHIDAKKTSTPTLCYPYSNKNCIPIRSYLVPNLLPIARSKGHVGKKVTSRARQLSRDGCSAIVDRIVNHEDSCSTISDLCYEVSSSDQCLVAEELCYVDEEEDLTDLEDGPTSDDNFTASSSCTSRLDPAVQNSDIESSCGIENSHTSEPFSSNTSESHQKAECLAPTDKESNHKKACCNPEARRTISRIKSGAYEKAVMTDSCKITTNSPIHIPAPIKEKTPLITVESTIITQSEGTCASDVRAPVASSGLVSPGHNSSHQDVEANPSPPLTPSLFPRHFPPTIHFPHRDEKYVPLLKSQQSLLKFKVSSITPNIVKTCLARVGFTKCSGGCVWMAYWGKHMKEDSFRIIKDHQKVNHFPGTFQIGRKDQLWRNLSKLQTRCGRKENDFFPQTYVLPSDLHLLRKVWEDSSKQKWIIKPPASARGIGIKLINHWSQVPRKKSLIIQKYLSNPYLINGMKFDLRVYVYVSSYDPLRIYIFRDGLVRFATCKYSYSMKHISNRFMHLTNYSINKHNSEFTPNTDESKCQGHKWGLLALWRYLNQELGVSTDIVWEAVKNVIVKTIISSEDYVSFCVRAYVKKSECVHELFGFDILLDQHLNPWVLEVNISPSLHSNSQLDINIKGKLVRDLFNIAGFKLHSKEVLTGIQTVPRLPFWSIEERMKHSCFCQKGLPKEERRKILDHLTGDDLRTLMVAEDELSRCGYFERVFPTSKYDEYRGLFAVEKYYNILLGEWTMKYERFPNRGLSVLRKLADDLKSRT